MWLTSLNLTLPDSSLPGDQPPGGEAATRPAHPPQQHQTCSRAPPALLTVQMSFCPPFPATAALILVQERDQGEFLVAFGSLHFSS